MSESAEAGGGSRPLVVSDDPHLVDEVLRLAAAAGASVDLAESAGAARAAWEHAPLVIVGHDRAAETAGLDLPRRPAVVVVAPHRDDTASFRLGMTLHAEQVVSLPEAEEWLTDRIADAREGPGRRAEVVSVIGGRGGAGASTTAAALALTAMREGLVPLLVDGDPLGGGLDLVVGGEDSEGMRWPDLVGAQGRVNGSTLQAVLPRMDHLTVLSWDRGDQLEIPLEAMHAVLGAATRTSDLVVLDLPRRIDDAAAAALARSRVTLLVVPAEVRAVAAAARVATGLSRHASDVRLLVRGPSPSRLPAEVVAATLGLPLAGSIRPETGLLEALERGDPPTGRGRGRGPLADFCRGFVAALWSGRAAA